MSNTKRRREWGESQQSSILNFFSKSRPDISNFSTRKRKPKLTPPHEGKENHSTSVTATTQSKKKRSTQLYLDFGQRNFGQQIVCDICNMLYVHGVAEDIHQHEAICKEYRDGVTFHIKKMNCRVVQQFSGGVGDQIVEIRSTDSYSLRQKVAASLVIVDQELGFAGGSTTASATRPKTTFLYIREKRVVGLALVEIVHRAYPLVMFENNPNVPKQRSNTPVPAMLGVYKLWTHKKARQQGLATRLVDAARQRMVYGTNVPAHMVAFSSPTEAGARFAQNYLQHKCAKADANKLQVLVYELR